MNIIIFGPQGSGKGTQADILGEKLNIPHITMGGLLRAEAGSESVLGEKIKTIINQGILVPDEITLELLKQRLDKPDCEAGFILDGYPRNLVQAADLEQVTAVDLALEIYITDEEALKRTGGRRNCLACGNTYHLLYKPSQQEGICDKCGAALIVREDDKDEVIKMRLNVYHQQTEPLVEYYQKQSVYLKIDGMPPIPEVTKEIFAKLKLI
ncbi:MAG: nucleoside monophosphate kinase [Candidatus Komeilibacteria bacterium]|nr:nucleoside monophosphate kinase [Candidatus Komeilibacteria bacterium]